MPDYNTVMKFKLFRNNDTWVDGRPNQRGKPNFGNSSFTIHNPVSPGEYVIAAWQYEDGSIGLDMQEKLNKSEPPAQPPAQPAAQPQQSEEIDDDDWG